MHSEGSKVVIEELVIGESPRDFEMCNFVVYDANESACARMGTKYPSDNIQLDKIDR